MDSSIKNLVRFNFTAKAFTAAHNICKIRGEAEGQWSERNVWPLAAQTEVRWLVLTTVNFVFGLILALTILNPLEILGMTCVNSIKNKKNIVFRKWATYYSQ